MERATKKWHLLFAFLDSNLIGSRDFHQLHINWEDLFVFSIFQRFFSSCAGGRGSYPDFHTSPAKLPKFLTGFQINYTSQIALLVFPLNFFSFIFICHNKIKEFIIKHTHNDNIGTITLSLTCLTSVAKEQTASKKKTRMKEKHWFSN